MSVLSTVGALGVGCPGFTFRPLHFGSMRPWGGGPVNVSRSWLWSEHCSGTDVPQLAVNGSCPDGPLVSLNNADGECIQYAWPTEPPSSAAQAVAESPFTEASWSHDWPGPAVAQPVASP